MNLFDSAKYNNKKSINTLLKRGHNNIDKALHGACENNDAALVTQIFNLDTDIKITRAILYAYKNNNNDIISLIKSKDTTNEDFDNYYKRAGICEGGHIEYVSKFYDLGCLSYACRGGHKDIVELLLKQNTSRDWLQICYLNYSLIGACERGSIELIEMMIEEGATNFHWALYGACKGGHWNIIQLFLDKCHEFHFGLEGACEGGHKKIIKLFLTMVLNNNNNNNTNINIFKGLEYLYYNEHYYLIPLLYKRIRNEITFYKSIESNYPIRDKIITLYIIKRQILPVNYDLEQIIGHLFYF